MTTASPRIRRAPAAAESARKSKLVRWAGAAPALVAMVLIAFGVSAAMTQNPQTLNARYQHDAEQALNSGDYKTARICYDRLLLSGYSGNPAMLFGLSRSLAGLGQVTEARQILMKIAPPDRPGYAPAHLLIAESILLAPNRSAKSLDVAEQHVRRVLEADPNNLDAQMMMAALSNARRSQK